MIIYSTLFVIGEFNNVESDDGDFVERRRMIGREVPFLVFLIKRLLDFFFFGL